MRTLIQNELSDDQQQEKLLAQWIACSFLLKACESSLVELTNATKATNDEGAAYLFYRVLSRRRSAGGDYKFMARNTEYRV